MFFRGSMRLTVNTYDPSGKPYFFRTARTASAEAGLNTFLRGQRDDRDPLGRDILAVRHQILLNGHGMTDDPVCRVQPVQNGAHPRRRIGAAVLRIIDRDQVVDRQDTPHARHLAGHFRQREIRRMEHIRAFQIERASIAPRVQVISRPSARLSGQRGTRWPATRTRSWPPIELPFSDARPGSRHGRSATLLRGTGDLSDSGVLCSPRRAIDMRRSGPRSPDAVPGEPPDSRWPSRVPPCSRRSRATKCPE